MTTAELSSISSQVRRDILRMTNGAKSGHPGGSLGCADLLTCLYFKVMKHNPDFSMEGRNEDVFFLSNGHISPVWYSVLARSGYFPVSELATFRKIDSRLQGHPATMEHLPGVRVASGSLGQGLSVAVGYALGKKIHKDDRAVFCLCGDGEMNEGQIWEAALFAAHQKADNLIAFTDRNFLQIDGSTEDVMALGNLGEKWKAFGWEVLETDGNDMAQLEETISKALSFKGKGKPVMVIMKTIMGKGVDFMENNHHWHGNAPSDEQLAKALTQLDETLGDY
ncbi:MAG: transketolase [Bacteroidia bacterium]|nr:transketolase [Bacteroidia bacterium]